MTCLQNVHFWSSTIARTSFLYSLDPAPEGEPVSKLSTYRKSGTPRIYSLRFLATPNSLLSFAENMKRRLLEALLVTVCAVAVLGMFVFNL